MRKANPRRCRTNARPCAIVRSDNTSEFTGERLLDKNSGLDRREFIAGTVALGAAVAGDGAARAEGTMATATIDGLDDQLHDPRLRAAALDARPGWLRRDHGALVALRSLERHAAVRNLVRALHADRLRPPGVWRLRWTRRAAVLGAVRRSGQGIARPSQDQRSLHPRRLHGLLGRARLRRPLSESDARADPALAGRRLSLEDQRWRSLCAARALCAREQARRRDQARPGGQVVLGRSRSGTMGVGARA